MAFGHGADLGLGTGLGGAPAAYDATRLEVWPPCGHTQRLATGDAGRALVADHASLRGLPATSCQKLQAGAPYSTSAPPLYLFDPRLLPLPDERPAGGPVRRQGAA